MSVNNKKVVRNFLWAHPLMGKGAAHVKSGKAKRQANKANLKAKLKRGEFE